MRAVSNIVAALALVFIAVIMASIASSIIASMVSSTARFSPPEIASSKLILLVRNAYQGGQQGYIVRVIATVVLPTDYPGPLMVCPLIPAFQGNNPVLIYNPVDISSGGWCRSIPSSAGSASTDFTVFIPVRSGYTYSDPSVWLVGVVDAGTRSVIHSAAPIFEVP
ncbi:MAG: hypothetical protein QXI64_10355 [Sulfolobales archaeon]